MISRAAGGALINAIFVQHFQDMARGHFTVRRLERIYGTEAVRRAYERIDRAARPRRGAGLARGQVVTSM